MSLLSNYRFSRLTVFAAVLALALFAPLSQALTVEFFYGTGCTHCAQVEPFIQQLEEEYPEVEFKEIEVYFNRSNALLLTQRFQEYGVPENQQGVPIVFVGASYLVGDTPILNNLHDLVESESDGISPPPTASPSLQPSPSPSEGKSELLGLTLPVVVGAALVDAINPCAFAVLIILLTTILAAGERKKALRAGLAFSAAIFISYFAMGFGLYHAIQWSGATQLIYKIVGVLAIIIGLLNLKDYFAYGAGGFVMEVPLSWRPAMKRIIRATTSVPGAFATGVVVSLFLLPCTSGPYIVILGLLASKAVEATGWLLLYNAIFVTPMLLITFAIYKGLEPDRVEAFRRTRLRFLHLIAGVVILVVGILLVLGLV